MHLKSFPLLTIAVISILVHDSLNAMEALQTPMPAHSSPLSIASATCQTYFTHQRLRSLVALAGAIRTTTHNGTDWIFYPAPEPYAHEKQPS